MKWIFFFYLLLMHSLAPVSGQVIGDYNLLVVQGYFDSFVEAELEAMGHSVTVEFNSNLTVDYDYSAYDAILFMLDSQEPPGMAEILSLNEANELGIILLRGDEVVSTCGLGISDQWSDSEFTIENNSHYITEPFDLGVLDLGFIYKSKLMSVNPGNTMLGSVSGGSGSLVVNNTLRRVLSPYYGHNDGMPWSMDAEILMDRIIAWAADHNQIGVDHMADWSLVKLYPNPTSEYLQTENLRESSFRILDMMGSVCLSGILPENGRIDISRLPFGAYVVSFDNKTNIQFIKN